MVSVKNIKTLTRKELKDYFDSPTAYIILIVFLLLWEFLFFRTFFLIGAASLRPLFDLLPWLFLILIPAITMRSVSREREEGTIEFILTHPISEVEFVVSKFFSSSLFIVLILLLTLPIPFLSSFFGDFDSGVIAGQYLGALLLAFVFISLGIFISSLFKSSVTSLLVSAVLSFLLVIAGFEFVTAGLPLILANPLERLSVLSHFASMSRGVIDLRDLFYFLAAISVFLSLAYLRIIRDKLGNQAKLYRSFKAGISLLVMIAILISIVGARIPGRIDLTQDRRYTLSEGTRKVLSSLTDIVNITLFSSERLPAQLQPRLRDVKDLLRDYQTTGKGNIIVSYKDPEKSPEINSEASSLGIRAVQFNVIGQEEFQVKTGYLGLAVSFAGKHETIPFIQDTSDLEYQLTSFIKKLTIKEKKRVAFLSGQGEKSIHSDYRVFSEELRKQFIVEELNLGEPSEKAEDEKAVPEGVDTLVIAGPNQPVDEGTQGAIRDFLAKGGSALFMIDAVTINPQMLFVTKNQNSFGDFLKTYGIEVTDDIVYDLRSNESIRFGGGFVSYIIPYPFWIRAVRSQDVSPITSRLESIILPWGSSIGLDEGKLKNGFQVQKLFVTTKTGGSQTDHYNVMPDQRINVSQDQLGEKIVAVSLMGSMAEDHSTEKKARMIVIGDSDFLTGQFAENSPGNIIFGLNAIDWLTQEELLAGIRTKSIGPGRLLFSNITQVGILKYSNFLFIIAVPGTVGLIHLLRRRSLMKKSY